MSSEILLQVAIATPLIASAFLLLFSGILPLKLQKSLTLVGFSLPAIIAITLFLTPTSTVNGYSFFSEYPSLGISSLGIWLKLGLNGISLPLFGMASIVGLAAGIRAITTKELKMPTLFFALLLFIQCGLLGLFASVDIFSFYIFHEFALIPTFIGILVWGNVAKRSTAITMAVYLTLGAMISLAGLVLFYTQIGAIPFDFGSLKTAFLNGEILVSESMGTIISGLLLFGFGILVSLFPFHSWAPDTYSSAPTPISMLHAGVLKKFGLYGLLQIVAILIPAGLSYWSDWILFLALGNIVIIGLITMIHRDLKQMISYSSVMHMGPIFLGIAAFAISGGDTTGLGAAVIMMFAHGLSVALLFHLGQSVADRTETYDMKKMGGLAKQAPVLAGFFVAATMASIGLPGFANFWGELSIFVSLACLKPFWLIGLVIISIIISAIYGLRAVAKIFYGKPSPEALPSVYFERIKDITISERIPALILFAALVLVGFVPSLITNPIQDGLKTSIIIKSDKKVEMQKTDPSVTTIPTKQNVNELAK